MLLGWWGAVPGGWPSTAVRTVWCQALSLPLVARPLGVGGQGSATCVSRVRLVWAWGPSTGPTACALAGRRCALWGWRKGVPRGGAFRRCGGRLSSGAPPPPAVRPLGGPSRSATHVLWARVCGCGGPARIVSLTCVPCGGLCATGVVGSRPRWGRPSPVARGVWCQALSLRSPLVLLGGQPGFRYPCVPGRGWCGRGETAPVPQRRAPLRPLLCAVGVPERRPRGGRLSPLSGASEVRRSPFPGCPPSGRAVGVRCPRAVGAGVRVWGPSTVPLACLPCGGCVPRGWWGAVPRGVGLPAL